MYRSTGLPTRTWFVCLGCFLDFESWMPPRLRDEKGKPRVSRTSWFPGRL